MEVAEESENDMFLTIAYRSPPYEPLLLVHFVFLNSIKPDDSDDALAYMAPPFPTFLIILFVILEFKIYKKLKFYVCIAPP